MPYLANFSLEIIQIMLVVDGYVPTFEGDLKDYNATIGFKSVLNDWNIDASFTTGGNSQTYKVNQSHNRNFVTNI
jgi:iron complex outermembrane receptor protein